MKGKTYRGEVVLWNEARGFGFIQAREVLPFQERGIFVHRSNCVDALSLGAHCQFEIGDPYKVGKKPQAVKVAVRANAVGLDVLAKAVIE